MSYKNPWTICNHIFDSEHIGDYIGFIYVLRDMETDRLYVGKKIFHNKKAKPPLKGKTKRRISYVESDWKDYYGSNPTIQQLMKTCDPYRFKREILHLCMSKSEMGYLETKELFDRGALISDQYFNDWITVRVTKKQLGAVRERLSR